MPKKRKEIQETVSVNKKMKNFQEEQDPNRELLSNPNPQIKVEEVEFDTLLENEAVLTIKESLEDFKLDLFDENIFDDPSPKTEDSLCGKQVDISSISTNKNINSSPYKSVAVKKIIEKQRDALKLIQEALMKFESVTKDLQEMVELDIVEAQTAANARSDEAKIVGTNTEVGNSKQNRSPSFSKNIRIKSKNKKEAPTTCSSLEEIATCQTEEVDDKDKERIKDPNSINDTSSVASSEVQSNSNIETDSSLPSTSSETGVVVTSPNRQVKGKIKDHNLKENVSLNVSNDPNNEIDPPSPSSVDIKNLNYNSEAVNSLPVNSDAANNEASNIHATNNLVTEYSQLIAEKSLIKFEKLLSHKAKFQQKLTLPTFSPQVMPYLLGENLDGINRKHAFNFLVNELIDHLDGENLLISSGPREQSIGYTVLQSKLLQKYPNMLIEPPKSSRKRYTKSKLGTLTTAISDRRRKRRERERKIKDCITLCLDEISIADHSVFSVEIAGNSSSSNRNKKLMLSK